MTDADTLLTPAEAAERLRVSEYTLLDWLRAGLIPGVKVGGAKKGRWRVRLSDIEHSVREAGPQPKLSTEAMDQTVDAIAAALIAGGTYPTRKESLKLMIAGVEHPTALFWKTLADGIRLLQSAATPEE